MKHKHAENMMLYAKDAMETDRPWERWEFKFKGEDDWNGLMDPAMWRDDCEYRRKQTTININGHEVPEPIRSPLNNETIYYIPYFHAMGEDVVPTYKFEWCGDKYDFNYLKKGFVHLSKEAASKHAKALLSFTRIEK